MKSSVYFRAFEEDDATFIYKWMNDDELKSMSVGLNRRMCRDEASEWVRTRMRHNPYQVWWAICSRQTDEMIGYLFLSDIHYINSSAEYGGILIGHPEFHSGIPWIESYLFIMEYVFERLNLNRFSDSAIAEHKQSVTIAKVMGFEIEGIKREAIYKGGKFHDLVMMSILKKDYFRYKEQGNYEIKSIIRGFAKKI